MQPEVRRKRRYAEETDKVSGWGGFIGYLVTLLLVISLVGYFFVYPFMVSFIQGFNNARNRRQQQPVIVNNQFPTLTVSQPLAATGLAASGFKIEFLIGEVLLEVKPGGKPVSDDMITAKITGKGGVKCKNGWLRFPKLNPGEKTRAKLYFDAKKSDIDSVTLDLK